MDMEEFFKTNINTVIEMILDEGKLVSYITVSRDLCINVNNSKQLLYSVIQKIREEQPNIKLNISYIMSGSSSDNAVTTTICTEDDLSKLRKSMKIVFFHHVYSVCRGSPGIDKVALLLLNKYEDYSLLPGTIKSKECTKRTSDEIGNLKSNSQEALVIENKSSVVVIKKLKQDLKPLETSTIGVIKEKRSVMQAETKIKVEFTSPKKDSNNKQISNKSNGPKTSKGIASFFNKSNIGTNSKVTNGLQTKNTTNDLHNKNESNRHIDRNLEEKMDLDNEYCDVPVSTKSEKITEKIKKEPKSKEEKRVVKKEPVLEEKNKTMNKIKKSSQVDKKRKRLRHVSDSEDENDPFVDNQELNTSNNDESEDEIPPTPLTANNIKITSGIINPKKRRKVVDKTYTDEEGYILTKKVEVYESCSSENEEENKVEIAKDNKIEKQQVIEVSPSSVKSSPKKSKKKISPPQKGKQPTLNSFFIKK